MGFLSIAASKKRERKKATLRLSNRQIKGSLGNHGILTMNQVVFLQPYLQAKNLLIFFFIKHTIQPLLQIYSMLCNPYIKWYP